MQNVLFSYVIWAPAEAILSLFLHHFIILFPHIQPSDADVMVGSAEDGGGEQKRERRDELHEITQWWSETAGVRTHTTDHDAKQLTFQKSFVSFTKSISHEKTSQHF